MSKLTRRVAARSKGAAPSYDADAAAYFAAMSSGPDDTRKGLINQLVLDLKSASLWAKLRGVQLLAAHDEQSGRVDLVLPSRVAAKVNLPTFLTDRGFTGDGVSSYLDTGIADSAGWQNDVSFGAWVNQAGSGGALWWNTNNSRLLPNVSARARSSTDMSLTGAGSALGLWMVNRSASAATQTYRNGSALASGSSASSAPTAVNLHTHRSSSGAYGTHRIAAVIVAASLDATEQANLATHMSTYLTAIGAN